MCMVDQAENRLGWLKQLRIHTAQVQEAVKLRHLPEAVRGVEASKALLLAPAQLLDADCGSEYVQQAIQALLEQCRQLPTLLTGAANKKETSAITAVTDLLGVLASWLTPTMQQLGMVLSMNLLPDLTLLSSSILQLGGAMLFEPRFLVALGSEGFRASAEKIRATMLALATGLIDFAAAQSNAAGLHEDQRDEQRNLVLLAIKDLVATVFAGLHHVGVQAQQLMGRAGQPTELCSLRNVNLGWKALADLLCRRLPHSCRLLLVSEDDSQALLAGCLQNMLHELAAFQANPRMERVNVLTFWVTNTTRIVEEFFSHVSPSNCSNVLQAALHMCACITTQALHSTHTPPDPAPTCMHDNPANPADPAPDAARVSRAAPPGACAAEAATAGVVVDGAAVQCLETRLAPRMCHLVLTLLDQRLAAADLGPEDTAPAGADRSARAWADKCAHAMAESLGALLQPAASPVDGVQLSTRPAQPSIPGRVPLMAALLATCASKQAHAGPHGEYGPVTLLAMAQHVLPCMLTAACQELGPAGPAAYAHFLVDSQAAAAVGPSADHIPSADSTSAPGPGPHPPTPCPPQSSSRSTAVLARPLHAALALLHACFRAYSHALAHQGASQVSPAPYAAAAEAVVMQLCRLASSPHPLLACIAADVLCAGVQGLAPDAACWVLQAVAAMLQAVVPGQALQQLQQLAEGGPDTGACQQEAVGISGLPGAQPLVRLLSRLMQASPPAVVHSLYVDHGLSTAQLCGPVLPTPNQPQQLHSHPQRSPSGQTAHTVDAEASASLCIASCALRCSLWAAFGGLVVGRGGEASAPGTGLQAGPLDSTSGQPHGSGGHGCSGAMDGDSAGVWQGPAAAELAGRLQQLLARARQVHRLACQLAITHPSSPCLAQHSAGCLAWMLCSMADSVVTLQHMRQELAAPQPSIGGSLQISGSGDNGPLGPGELLQQVAGFASELVVGAMAVSSPAGSMVLAGTGSMGTDGASGPDVGGGGRSQPAGQLPSVRAICVAPALHLLANLLSSQPTTQQQQQQQQQSGILIPTSMLAQLANGPLEAALQQLPSARPYIIPVATACCRHLSPPPTHLMHALLHTCLLPPHPQYLQPAPSQPAPGLEHPQVGPPAGTMRANGADLHAGRWLLQHQALQSLTDLFRAVKSNTLLKALVLPRMMPGGAECDAATSHLFKVYGRQRWAPLPSRCPGGPAAQLPLPGHAGAQATGAGCGGNSDREAAGTEGVQACEERVAQWLAEVLEHARGPGSAVGEVEGAGWLRPQPARSSPTTWLHGVLETAQRQLVDLETRQAAGQHGGGHRSGPETRELSEALGSRNASGTSAAAGWASNPGLHPRRPGGEPQSQMSRLAAAGTAQVHSVRKQLDVLQAVVACLLEPPTTGPEGGRAHVTAAAGVLGGDLCGVSLMKAARGAPQELARAQGIAAGLAGDISSMAATTRMLADALQSFARASTR